MRKITLPSFFVLFSFLAFGQTPCSPVSPLNCPEVIASLPVALDFDSSAPNTILDNIGQGTGFTAVLEHSEARRGGATPDLSISDPTLNGYEPSLLTLGGGALQMQSQAGIAFRKPGGSSNNNNQVNTLGVGFNDLSESIIVKTTLNNIITGGGSAQAGVWYGYDEDNFVKLNVNDSNIELRVESNGLSGNGTTGTDQVQLNLGASGNDVGLEMIIDPESLTAVAYYTIASGARTLLGSLPIPESYFTGRDIDLTGGQDNMSFAGIFATHRNGTQFTAIFDEFSVETPPTLAFEAHVNFQNSPLFTAPPTGYVVDYGKEFGNTNNAITLGTENYTYGWKLASDGTTPIDVSQEASGNGGTGATGGAGRNRLGGDYAGASLEEKLEGTLVHFQGDNIRNNDGTASWAGQPRGSELIWELEVPNGTYDVTISLGDADAGNLDSRHSATVEGYTVVPAFVPAPGENRNTTITVAVSDGLLTVNGLGGFNSKINYIDVVKGMGTPVSGDLAFLPNPESGNLDPGTSGTLISTLSGAGAVNIGLVINDNINTTNKELTGTNDWLTLPATNILGQFDFAIAATTLSSGDTRNNTIIATASGFRPALLEVDLTVSEAPLAAITAPYRINIAGGDYDLDGNLFVAEDVAYLEGASEAGTSDYGVVGGNGDLYHPRRFADAGQDFGYRFPIANGDYQVALHMADNYFETAGERIFDVSIEGNLVIDNIDLAENPGPKIVEIRSIDVTVSDGELNIDFTSVTNNAIVQAIEIFAAAPPQTEILVINEIMFDPNAVNDATGEWFELYNPATEDVDIRGWVIKDNDTDTHTISNDGPLLVPSGGYLVLGNSSDVGINGGKIVDYQYTGFTLANAGDEVVLVDDSENEIDRVEYDGGTTFPAAIGASIALNDPLNDNNLGGNWAAATTIFGTGDLGTPGVSTAGKANESPVITSLGALEVDENGTAAIDVEVTDDQDSEGSGIAYTLSGIDAALFAIEPGTGVLTFIAGPDFEIPGDDGADNIYNIQVTATDSGSLVAIQELAITVGDVDETLAFEAHVNFQDNPASTTPPAGYLADYGKEFGFNQITFGSVDYDFGWKLLETGVPFDASDEVANNSTGVGRMRLGNIANYNAASLQEKLEGTLVHFQGHNIAGWEDGQPRKNELFWELEIPNGTYEVTLGLGDKLSGNIDSRHSATLEGFTILPAFNPVDQEVRTGSLIVAVTDGFLTMGGLGGYNSKITHIDVIESSDTPVNGVLSFLPATANETLEAGANGTFSSELSGSGAIDIGLVIDDNVDESGSNDWLTLPTKTDLGQFDFAIDATALVADDTRSDVIIATAKGFVPASLSANLTVTEVGNEVLPCSPLSTLPCDQLAGVLPVSLDFTTANGNLSESGMTMVLEPSARLAVDDAIADANVPGYALSLIAQNAAGLSVTSTKGIFYSQLPAQGAPSSSDTNSQMNALGVGMATPTNSFSISSTFETPDFSVSTGNHSQQAGIWYGLDEDHYMKLAILKTNDNNGKVQLQVENMDGTTSATAYLEINSAVIPSGSGDIRLRLEIDPINTTVKGYYALNGGTEILVSEGGIDNLPVPPSYLAGTGYDSENPSESLNFAGIFTTHRRAAANEPITVLFKDFEIAEAQQPLALLFDVNALNFEGLVGEAIAPQSVSVSASAGNPTFKLSDDPDASQWLNFPEGTVTLADNTVAFPLGDIEFGIQQGLVAGTYSATIFATDEPDSGYANAEMTISLTITDGTVQTPRIVGVTPADGATQVSVTPTISANDLFLPNFDTDGNAGVDNSTITNTTVKLFKQGSTVQVGASVNGTGGGDAINLAPNLPLEANTTYVFEIDGVLDLVGEPFEPFTSSFTTGNGNTGPTTDLDNVSFTRTGAVATGSKYSTLTIGPDGKLYGLVISGDIHRWTMNADGTLADKETLSAWKSAYGSRTSVGMVFDPTATAANLIAYVSHDSGGLSGAPDWDGKISRLTGANLETEELLVTDLPRSTKDHLTNSLTFRTGEPNMLYFNQGSNSAAGKPDGAWGNREESLLTAATLRLDLSKLPSTLPLNVRTTRDATAINNVDINSPTLDGLYNPYYVNAPLTLFATGIRNAYDLVWHSNGQLYVPTNGTAGGSNAPASIDGTRRPDGTIYDHSNSLYPVIPSSDGNNTQRDWLFRIDPNTSIGYYGHSNPFRGEFVLNRGDVDVNNSVYNGVQADENYRGAAFDFELNKSPNGVIEYRSNAENGNLQGAILVVRYSGSSDIIALVPDGPNGDIDTFKEGIPGFGGFQDPLDLVEDVSNGNIYVSDYGRNEIVLLKPSNQAAPKPRIVLNIEEVTGDAITGSGTFTQEVVLSNLGNTTLVDIDAQLTGANADQFTIIGLASSINAQNSTSFSIEFTPTSNGPKFAQLALSGTDADVVTIPLRGLGKTGLGGSNEPSLQWILDTQLGDGIVEVGDTNTATNLINLPNGTTYNDILGDEVAVQTFERAIDAPVTLEVLSVYGPTANNPVVAFGWYSSGNAASATELFTVSNSPESNGQTLNAPLTGVTEFDPGTQSFGFYSRWPFFGNRQLFSEDALNTFANAIPHHVRVYELPGEQNAYIIATEEHISGFDYQDIVVIARNIRPVDDTPTIACSPISALDCDQLEVSLPFTLDFDGTEGGLNDTGFTMVDNPSARLAVDGSISNPDVPGYEPGKLGISGGNLIINANNGIAYRTNGSGADQSTDVNSQINTLGVGVDAGSYGNFSISTSIVNPYTDASSNSEQAGIWFGLDEDSFVKLVANSGGAVELRSELNGISVNGVENQVTANVPGLNSGTVGLRLYVDIQANNLTAFYTLNNGAEVEVGTLALPSQYISGNASYDNLSFAGVFATKRREMTADVDYTFEDFTIAPDNAVVFDPININFSLPTDVPPANYLVDSGLGYSDRGNSYTYGWLTVDGNTALNLSERARNRNVGGIGILQNTLVHMQFQNVDPAGQEGIWEIEVPNGTYDVTVGVGDPNVDGQAGTEPFHTINVEGVNAVDRYSPTGLLGTSTRFSSGTATATVTDGRLTIDASGGFNTKINSLQITKGGAIEKPFFASVNPADNATNVAINEFQITVDVVVPEGYELDKATLAGNVNLYEIVNGNQVLVPSNSNDTGGGDAITLTPLSELKEFTDYRFRLSAGIEANKIGDLNDRLSFVAFESGFTTGDQGTLTPLDLTGVEFTKIEGGTALGDGTIDQRFSSLVVGPDGKLYASTIGNFSSDGQIFRWDMAADGSLSNLEILSPALQGAPHPVNGARNNNNRLIIGFAFDPAATADNLIAYVTHSFASETDGPEWDGVLTRLSGPDLSEVQDLIIHLPRSSKDHLTNSITFDPQGVMFINQGSNSAGGQPDGSWAFRPERLLSAAVLKLELNKLPGTLPFSAHTTDDIGIINSASSASATMSDGTYNPFATNAPLTLFSTGVRNAYDLVWHSNGWLYVPTNGTAGGSNTPATADYDLARRIDGLTSVPSTPSTNSNETQKDWLFKTQGGSYHGHPNPFRGEFILNHGGASYSGVPGQQETSHTDVTKYPDNLGPDSNYREPAYDFEFNKSPNGVIEYKSDAFGGKLQGLLMVVRFSGQDDLLVMQPEANGNIGNVNGDVPGLGGFDDPLDVVEDPNTGNIYVSEYDRSGNGRPKLTLLRAMVPATIGPAIAAAPSELIFETTVNGEGDQTQTRTVAVTNDGNEILNISSASITGTFAAQFEAVEPAGTFTVNPGESQTYTITYAPDLDGSDLGYQEASLTIESDDPENPSFSIGLHALKKAGFEGGEEPALQDVVDALGIGINVGWTSLSSNTNPASIGDEVEVERWVKVTDAPINITPVGRYSPQEELPFGWYTNDGNIVTNEVGVLAGGIENAQTLFPPIASGDAAFDPQGAVFGFYVESNSFGRFNYTEDAINTGGVVHRTRIYPMMDREGNPIENSYLINFEDASNGDYQDYMFIIDNVIPYESGLLALDFNKGEVDFIASINQGDIPVQQVTLSGNGGITSAGINLESSEDWIVLPDTYELDVPFDVGVDASGLPIGSYQATITASAPNYEDAVVNIALEITNELVYTYQFNFQTPEDVEISPEGYIDDIGAPYGEQSTILGDLTYGWVLPGTMTPADAGVNGRNRASAVQDGVLLKTFTIIGHATSETYPLLDWVVNVPNGTYSVNISVGERDFSDSNHVLDVNGTTVVSFDQENNNPDNLVYFEGTKFVDVTDGVLRLSLNPQGINAKPNYIRLAPIDTSLLPPTILADFEGTQSAEDTYRGAVDITLQATDNSESGGIALLEYALDGNVPQSYTQPISVGGEGAHTLVVTAEDNNGNRSEKTFGFSIETPTGALLAVENMTKVPGTDRGFPADDYYTFHRLGDPGQGLVHDSNVMRLNNTGTGDLIVTDAILSDTGDYAYEVLDNTGATVGLPITIPAGSFADLDITFIGTTGNGSNGIFVEDIEILSNADNALENIAVLHGAYSPQPEGGDEINAQEVFDAFGFRSSMLSIVNDEGTITPPNDIRFRPSSDYPEPANIDAGYEGDMILSDTFIQADPSKPVIGIQLSALHGGPSSNGAKLVAVDGTGTVGGINFSHDAGYYQTLLPKNGENINYDTAGSISGPFRIAVSNYLSSGGNNINGDRPDLLGLRIYKVIDRNGNIVPNEYIVLQDFVQGGCGAGSANCDWNDNTFYFINIRPEGIPTAQPGEAYLAHVEEPFSLDVAQYFDNGYPGNTLTIAASVAGGALPMWMSYNPSDGTLSGTPPAEATGNIVVNFEAIDGNGLTASTSLTININEAPMAVDDEVTTSQNVAVLLDGLLANDSEPNGQEFSILTVDTPNNGQAVLQADGISILYTPDTDYIGSDLFTYTIEDETGLTATADVAITVTAENQAPTALIITNIEEGPAALFVEFTGSGSTDDSDVNLQYAWDFGDGLGSSTDPNTSYTFTSAGVYTVNLRVTDSEGLFDDASRTITVSAPPNTGPTAVAVAIASSGNPLQFAFDGSGSTDTEGAVDYQWNFGDGNSSTETSPNHTYAVAGAYEVKLTVTDEGDLTDSVTLQVVAEEPVNNGFALRINAGGPEVIYNGDTYVADQNFAGGKVYTNTGATVPLLYQSERSASPPTFGYNIPLENGTYQLTLHFAEIYHGAVGGGSGGTGKRVFDVTLEGSTILDDYDINADVGSQTVVTKTFEISVEDGVLNLVLDAAGGDGVDQPKLSAITVLGIGDPIVECELPEEWTASDIGAVAADGETCHDSGRFEVSASGADIWGSADEFHFVYRELEGDGEIVARVLGLDPVNEWAKAGVMMRNDLDANSASALMILAPDPQSIGGPGYSFQHRPAKGATMGNGNFTAPTLVPGGFPHYVRIVRSGNTFTGYISETDGSWTQVGSTNIAMGQSIFVGLATTSHADGTLTDAVYENVEVIETMVPNVAPTAVAEATPLNGEAPLQVRFTGSNSTDDENTDMLSYMWTFDNGDTSTDADPIYTFDTAGIYEVLLTVSDEEGETDDATVTITVEEPVVPGEFALRINAGGPELVHNGETFVADQSFVGGKSYVNTEAQLPVLYQTERSALPPNFGYEIPLTNGNYRVTLHFAELFWDANGGSSGGVGSRVFDVVMEGNTILNDYDIIADVGSQTVVTKTFDVLVSDGQLSLALDAAGSDGKNEPKLSAITVLGIGDPIVECELPEEWTASDIGAVAADGETCHDSGRFEVSASGADIWGSADEFHFVYRELEGDGEIVARVLGLDPVNEWAKAGVMMRNDLDANSASALMILAPDPQSIGGPGYSFQHRPTKGATMGNGNFTAPTLVPGGFPHYVRIVRSGNTFTGYISETDGSWTQVGSTNIAMGQSIFVGLATTSHADGTLTDAVYENVEVIETVVPNAAPMAVANASTVSGEAPLQVAFSSVGSDDDKGIVSYAWDFKDGATSNAANPQHTFDTPGMYNVSLTVSDAEGETDMTNITISVNEPPVNDFALRINAGGPQVVHNGETFSADTNFVGGKAYANNSATVPSLYQTERSALPPSFAYNVPVDNGNYQVVLHFAEIYWGATGGGTAGSGKRIFDVSLEGAVILNDYDINADVGPQTVEVKTFDVVVSDGVLSLAFDATGNDGIDQPKVSAIEILGVGASKLDPVADAGADIEISLPSNGFTIIGSGNDPDGGAVSYQWTQIDGPDTALMASADTPQLTAEVLVEGSYTFRLTVTDDEGVQTSDEVMVTAVNANQEQVWLEAECAIVGTGWNPVNDGSAAGGQYLLPPAGFSSSASSIGNAVVTFNFSVTAGTYKIFGRVKTPSGTEDSFWVRVNGGAWVRWNNIPASNGFVWHRIHLNEQLSQPRSFEFVDGVNQVEIGHRESGAALDKLYITQTDDIPTGLGGTSTNCGGTGKTFDPNVIAENTASADKSLPEGFNAPIANEISMYPNAAASSTQITMSNPEADIAKLYVYDVSGRLILSYEGLELKTSPGEYVLQVSNLENGVYLLRMMTTDGNVYDEKLIVRH